MKRSGFLVIAVLLSLALPTRATWNQLAQFNSKLSCGFFFDAQHGLIGSGYRFDFSSPAKIYLTNDGGANWSTANTPVESGAVTSISMIDRMRGYASIFGLSQSLWVTTDGGQDWSDLSPAGFDRATSVFANANIIALTTWSDLNGISTDGGMTWRAGVLGAGHTNMVTFANATHGVTIMRSADPPYSTTDGGATWLQPAGIVPEAWSIFADTLAGAYYLANEGDMLSPLRSILRSIDNGMTWNALYTFADPQLSLTGHITGAAGRLYIQTVTGSSGLYRSNDGGTSWIPIGGPFGARDMRFVTAGCNGGVIYAFDDSGGIWQTTDGGDGTLEDAKMWTELHPANISTPAGDTISIPIYLSTNATKPIEITGRANDTIIFILNTDFLTPVGLDSTLSPLILRSLDMSGDTVRLIVDASGIIVMNGGKVNTKLGNLRFVVRVAPVLSCNITLASSSIAVNYSGCSPSAITNDSVLVTLAPRCGDSLLWMLLRMGELELRINPNPAATYIHCELTGHGEGAATITILDRLGRTVMTQEADRREVTLDARLLSAGIYGVVVRLDGCIARGKFVVDR